MRGFLCDTIDGPDGRQPSSASTRGCRSVATSTSHEGMCVPAWQYPPPTALVSSCSA